MVRNLSTSMGGSLSSLSALTNTLIRAMSHEVRSQHQKGEPKAIVGASLGGDDLTERAGDEFVGKGPLGDGLGEDGVGAGDGGADDEGGQEGDLGDGGEHARRGAEPHHCHDGQQAEGHLLPAVEVVPGGELVAGDDELDADHDSGDALDSFVLASRSGQVTTFKCGKTGMKDGRTKVMSLV